ncbi:MAG: nucleotide exchange factor GrpE [Planctomycetota bacterium]
MKRHEKGPPAGEEARDDAPVEAAETPEGGSDLETAARERDEYLASWKRATADYQNLRRRLQSDLESAVARAKTGILGDLLLVLDFLDMALATPVTTEEGRNLHAGVEATRTALHAVLEREGVRPIPEGGRFDPAFHDCVARVPAEGVEPGTVVEVLRRGYLLEGRILRPAQVRVAGADESPRTE